MAATRRPSSSVPNAVLSRRSGDPAFSIVMRSSKLGGGGAALEKKRENSFIEPP
jgi:hypothetical protein